MYVLYVSGLKDRRACGCDCSYATSPVKNMGVINSDDMVLISCILRVVVAAVVL